MRRSFLFILLNDAKQSLQNQTFLLSSRCAMVSHSKKWFHSRQNVTRNILKKCCVDPVGHCLLWDLLGLFSIDRAKVQDILDEAAPASLYQMCPNLLGFPRKSEQLQLTKNSSFLLRKKKKSASKKSSPPRRERNNTFFV